MTDVWYIDGGMYRAESTKREVTEAVLAEERAKGRAPTAVIRKREQVKDAATPERRGAVSPPSPPPPSAPRVRPKAGSVKSRLAGALAGMVAAAGELEEP